MPRPIKKRAEKKETREENIQHTLEHFREGAAARQKQLLIGGIAIALVVAVVLGLMYFRAGTERKVAELEYQGYKEFNGLYTEVPDPLAVRAERAIEYFQQAADIKPSPFSLYYIGLCYYAMGRFDSAADALQRLTDTYPEDNRFIPPGLYKLGMAHLTAGRNEQALEIFGRFRNVGIKAFGDLALLESARILEEMGQAEEAVAMYETLVFEYPASVFADEARQKTARVDEPQPAAGDRPLVLLPEGEDAGGRGQPLKIK